MNETLAAVVGATFGALLTMLLSLRGGELMKKQHQDLLLRAKRIKREISLGAGDKPFALRQRLSALAAVAPRAAVLEGWRAIEQALQEVAGVQGAEQLIDGGDVTRLLRVLSSTSPDLAKSLLSLREVRNRILYANYELSPTEVEPFLLMVGETVHQLKTQSAEAS